MFSNILIIVPVVIVAISGVATADLCAAGSKEIDGNWFCQAVEAIQYSNVGTAGVYNQITAMNADGTCASQSKSFSGPISPLDEEVSIHFRGPLQLKQLAIYTPSSSTTRKVRRNPAHRHGEYNQHYQHLHQRAEATEGVREARKEMRQMVTATIDGQVVSWENNWFGIPTYAPVANPVANPAPMMVTATIDGQVVSWVNNYFGPSGATSEAASSVTPTPITTDPAPAANPKPTEQVVSSPTVISSPPPHPGLSNNFDRVGYYNSTSQTLDNLAFLGNFGGQGSGVWDTTFGNSLSYINSAGTGGAASPQILADTVIPTDAEVIVMLGEDCGDGGCGYVRPGSIAHHGVAGADKIFLMEFSMPMDGNTGFNGDMPSIWLLNAQIPRTLQYGDADCSCWESGCGELDIAEALFDGSAYLKSTLHTNRPGGDSDYLVRPTAGTMKLAVVFSSNTSTIQIQVLNDNAVFPTSLAASDVNAMCEDVPNNQVSHFAVS